MLVREKTGENKRLVYAAVAFFAVAIWIILVSYSFLTDIFLPRIEVSETKIEIYDISGLQELASNIYKTGETESSIYALNYYIGKLDIDRSKYKPGSQSFDSITNELGLAHARLYSLYEKKGESNLSRKEYDRSIELIGNRFNVKTPFELQELLKRLD